jgi:hypothetical protein
MPQIPKWAWWILCAVVVLILLVLLKFSFSIGPEGINIHQNLVH